MGWQYNITVLFTIVALWFLLYKFTKFVLGLG